MKRRGFTLIELLVVISIIALLISLLLPALARAKILALRIECASNLQQIGIALHEYTNEYRGQYPLANVGNFPFADQLFFGSESYPIAGLPMLYYDSFGVVNNAMVNPRPGILSPTATGLSLLYCPEPAFITEQNQIPPSSYNAQGLLTNWWLSTNYCNWIDRGINYKPAYDAVAVLHGVHFTPYGSMNSGGLAGSGWTFLNADPGHEPVLNPQSSSGSILVTDNASFQDAGATTGKTNLFGQGADEVDSNHVDGTMGNFLPAGEHELYNDGSVRWVPMSNIKARVYGNGVFFGW